MDFPEKKHGVARPFLVEKRWIAYGTSGTCDFVKIFQRIFGSPKSLTAI